MVGVAVNRNYDSVSVTAPSKSAAAGRVNRFAPTALNRGMHLSPLFPYKLCKRNKI
jgi:hypothetical protein